VRYEWYSDINQLFLSSEDECSQFSPKYFKHLEDRKFVCFFFCLSLLSLLEFISFLMAFSYCGLFPSFSCIGELTAMAGMLRLMKANKSANCFFLLSIAALAYQISRLRFWK
jgi:hypothetical protein